MKRWVVRLAACLILGAITTVAVAWACALDVLAETPEYARRDAIERFGSQGEHVWTVRERRRAGEWRIDSVLDEVGHAEIYSPGVDPGELMPSWFVQSPPEDFDWPPPGERLTRTVSVRGWPLPALWYELRWSWYQRSSSLRITSGIDTGRTGTRSVSPMVLPVKVLPAPFAFDTALFSAAWMALLFGPRAIRTAHRRRSGRCLACGYDLRGDHETGCPECGWNRMPEAPPARTDLQITGPKP